MKAAAQWSGPEQTSSADIVSVVRAVLVASVPSMALGSVSWAERGASGLCSWCVVRRAGLTSSASHHMQQHMTHSHKQQYQCAAQPHFAHTLCSLSKGMDETRGLLCCSCFWSRPAFWPRVSRDTSVGAPMGLYRVLPAAMSRQTRCVCHFLCVQNGFNRFGTGLCTCLDNTPQQQQQRSSSLTGNGRTNPYHMYLLSMNASLSKPRQ